MARARPLAGCVVGLAAALACAGCAAPGESSSPAMIAESSRASTAVTAPLASPTPSESSSGCSGPVVFLGDSITELSTWADDFGVDAVGLGVSGDTTDDVLARLDDVEAAAPSAVFLLVGVNDLARGASPDEALSGIEAILAGLRDRAPDAWIGVQSIYPVRWTPPDAPAASGAPEWRSVSAELGRRIEAADQGLERAVASAGATVIDEPRAALTDADGQLCADCTIDGLHLSQAGYERVRAVLDPYVIAAAACANR